MCVSKEDGIILQVFFFATMILGITGNGLVIGTVCLTKSMRKRQSNFHMLTLSIGDFLVCLVVTPYYLASLIKNDFLSSARHNIGHCKIFLFFTYSIGTISILSLALMSLDRALAIRLPYVYINYVSKRIAILMNTYIWVQSCATSLTAVLFDDFTEYYGQPGTSCGLKWESKKHFPFIVLSVSINFVIPALVITISNAAVFATAKRQQQKIAKDLGRSYGVKQESCHYDSTGDDGDRSTAEVEMSQMRCPLEAIDEQKVSDDCIEDYHALPLKGSLSTGSIKSQNENETAVKKGSSDLLGVVKIQKNEKKGEFKNGLVQNTLNMKESQNEAKIYNSFVERRYEQNEPIGIAPGSLDATKTHEKNSRTFSSCVDEFSNNRSGLMSWTLSSNACLNPKSEENQSSFAVDRQAYLMESTRGTVDVLNTKGNENQCETALEASPRRLRYLLKRSANVESTDYGNTDDKGNGMVLESDDVVQHLLSNGSNTKKLKADEFEDSSTKKRNSSQSVDYKIEEKKHFSVSKEKFVVLEVDQSLLQDAAMLNNINGSDTLVELDKKLERRRCCLTRSANFEISDDSSREDLNLYTCANVVPDVSDSVSIDKHTINEQPCTTKQGQQCCIKQRNRQNGTNTYPPPTSNRVSNPGVVRSKEFIIALSTLILAITFLITWLPFIVSRVASLVIPHLASSWRLTIYTSALTILTSTLNPCIILITRRDIRNELIRKFSKHSTRESVVSSFAE